jgi:predicted DNA-binding transcriptional regulator AlpA
MSNSKQQQQTTPLVWPWAEICARLGVSLRTGERMLRRGDFPPLFRLGPQNRFARPADVEAWLAEKVRISAQYQPRARSIDEHAAAV